MFVGEGDVREAEGSYGTLIKISGFFNNSEGFERVSTCARGLFERGDHVCVARMDCSRMAGH